MMTTVTEENFNQEVLASSDPVLIHFRAPWCGICRLITPIVNSVQSEWAGNLRLIDVNADENFKLTNQYKLRTLPTLLYMEKGKIIHRIEGFTNHEAFRAQLQDLAYRYRLENAFFSKSA
ncbi:MAG: thioredoxin domain-containing protein [Cyanobacteria bacterium J06597_16]